MCLYSFASSANKYVIASIPQKVGRSFISFQVCPSLDGNFSLLFTSFNPSTPSHLHSKRVRFSHRFLIMLLLILSGNVEPNPGPVVISSNIEFACLNIRSALAMSDILDKPYLLREFIIENSLDLLALTETWLQPDTPPCSINSIVPPGYSIINSPRKHGKGGGIALIYRSYLNIKCIPIPSFVSFESVCTLLSVGSISCKLLLIYRSPSSSIASFLEDFSELLTSFASSPSDILISGDFNIHVDNPSAPYVSTFLSLLESFNLTQHIKEPTHEANHTLDLLISRSDSTLISSHRVIDPDLSDHLALLASLNVHCPRLPSQVRKTFRSLKSIDTSSFCNDIRDSPLNSSYPSNLNEYLKLFSVTLQNLLDKHAPYITRSFSTKTRQPFITQDILKAKALRSRLEKIYRMTKLPSDKQDYKAQSRLVAKLITQSRQSYFKNLISDLSSHPRELWSCLNSLLGRSNVSSLPSFTSPSSLATSFMNFFSDKIVKLSSNLCPDGLSPHWDPISPPATLTHFTPASEEEVRQAILSSSDATCDLDFIPTKLLKSCLDPLLRPITHLVNLCIREGTVPDIFKQSLISPTLKKPTLPKDDLSSYRPISHLNFLSKILERIIHKRLLSHLHTFNSFPLAQSAYRKFYSVETALLKIQNDLLLAIDKKHVSALVLLDLSAAFDTVDHQILLTRLSSYFGISDSALNLISSYLTNRTQSVVIDKQTSPPTTCGIGVPQGSVLGPLLFTLYTCPLANKLQSSIPYHMYADDTQLYISFSASDHAASFSHLSDTLDTVHKWLSRNCLSLNPSKTEFLLIGTPQQRQKLTVTSFSFSGQALSCSDSVRNLGVILDSDLSYEQHISTVCKISHHYIRQIRRMRPVLDRNTAVLLANSLVSSRLDFCNSLYFNLPNSSIKKLQLVQNSLARVITPSVRKFDHISSTLQDLHWLPIQQRITYKIALLTFKTLQFNEPSYLRDLITHYIPTRHLRSDSKFLLTVPRINTSAGRRSFSFAAPHVWNSLPLQLRSTKSLSSFRSLLKTYLFPP